MALDALLARLEGRVITPVTSDPITDVTPKPAPILACTSVTSVTSVTAQDDDTAAEARRQRVLAMLAEHPYIRRAVVVDNADDDPVLVSVGIRDVATFELAISAAKFDAFLLLDLIDRHGATVH